MLFNECGKEGMLFFLSPLMRFLIQQQPVERNYFVIISQPFGKENRKKKKDIRKRKRKKAQRVTIVMVSFIHCPINNAVLVNTFQKRKAKGGFDWSATGLKEKEMTRRRWRKNISDSVVTLLVMPHSWIERTYIIISITIMEDCQKIERKSLPTLRVSLFFFHLIHVFCVAVSLCE